MTRKIWEETICKTINPDRRRIFTLITDTKKCFNNALLMRTVFLG